MRRSWRLLVLGSVLVAMLSRPSFAHDLRLIEPDEVDTDTSGAETCPAAGAADGYFDIRSPYRNSDGTVDDWRNINGMYNEPRDVTYKHTGVDIDAPDGWPVYPVHGTNDSSGDHAWVVMWRDDGNIGYGKWVWVRHYDNINGTTYCFDTFYGHARDVLVDDGATVYPDTPIAQTGCTGHCYGPHVHLEFRTLYAKASDGTSRRHPPAAFYWRKAPSPWGVDTSFITRLPNYDKCVRFRTMSKHSDGPYNASSATLYYKVGSSGSWTSAAMTEESPSGYCLARQSGESQTGIHYFDLRTVASGETVYFYVGTVDGKTGYEGYRPWRHSDGTHPTDRPFEEYVPAPEPPPEEPPPPSDPPPSDPPPSNPPPSNPDPCSGCSSCFDSDCCSCPDCACVDPCCDGCDICMMATGEVSMNYGVAGIFTWDDAAACNFKTGWRRPSA